MRSDVIWVQYTYRDLIWTKYMHSVQYKSIKRRALQF